MLIRSISIQKKILEKKKIRDKHFIGVRVGCLKINRNYANFFSLNEHFYLFSELYSVSPTKIIVTF